jgi:hypothetical protein
MEVMLGARKRRFHDGEELGRAQNIVLRKGQPEMAELLVAFIMSVTRLQRMQDDFIKKVKINKKRDESEGEDVLIFTRRIIPNNMERGANIGTALKKQKNSVKEVRETKVGIMGPTWQRNE